MENDGIVGDGSQQAAPADRLTALDGVALTERDLDMLFAGVKAAIDVLMVVRMNIVVQSRGGGLVTIGGVSIPQDTLAVVGACLLRIAADANGMSGQDKRRLRAADAYARALLMAVTPALAGPPKKRIIESATPGDVGKMASVTDLATKFRKE